MGKKTKKIKVVIFEPFKSPYIKEIENNVDTFQSIVDGWIDYIRLDNNIDIICNDSFLFDKAEYPNRSIFRYGHETFIFGTFFFIKTAYDDDGDYHISLSDEEIKKILSDFEKVDDKIITKIFDENVLKTNIYNYGLSFESASYFAKVCFMRNLLIFEKSNKNLKLLEGAIVGLPNLDNIDLPDEFDNNLSYIEYVLYF